MAYSEILAERIKNILTRNEIIFEEKKMFGGVAFMVDEKMCVGVIKEDLMARINPDFQEEAIKIQGCREMDFTNRPMKGYVYVDEQGMGNDEQLTFWIKKSLEYNPLAKSSKRKKK